jgi:ribosomal protein S18 acetylase RimI-like enzyme
MQEMCPVRIIYKLYMRAINHRRVYNVHTAQHGNQPEGVKWKDMMVEIAISSSARGHLRRLDMRRDLVKVADLVEICFYDTLDPEGKQYLNDLRKAAQNASLMGFASSLIEDSSMPPSGYVWEEDGRLVGNLSLIPIAVHGKKGYMIANVATHPDYRGRGIAKQLTVTALRHARDHGAATAWLQVRDDNPSAIHIYAINGFEERFRRSSWYNGPDFIQLPTLAGVRVGKREASHWTLQREWLKSLYPDDITWHLPFDWNLFRADAWGKFYRAFNLEFLNHWSVERNGELKGVLSWKHSSGFTDTLWLAIPEQFDQEAVLALLLKARIDIRQEQPLSLNFPSNTAIDVLRQAGFYAHQTLIWMEYKFLHS